jgi:exonuclease SbcC
MIINNIRVANFASYVSGELPLGRLGKVVLVYGPTGAGKTTLLIDAVTAALFGRAYGVSKKESRRWVIMPGASQAEVELDFSVGDKRYLLRRIIPKKGQGAVELLKILEGGEERLASREQEVDAMINRLIGLDYVTFLNTIAVRQGEVDELLRAEPQKRRDVFLRAFAIDFTKYKEKAKEKRDAIEMEIKEAEGKIEVLREQISKEPQIRAKLKDTREAYLRIRERLRKLRREYYVVRQRRAGFETQLRRVEKKLARISEKEKRAKEVREELRKLLAEKIRLEEENRKIQEMEEKLKEDKRCHTIYSKIQPLVIRIGILRKELTVAKRRTQTLEDKVSQLPSLLTQLREAKKAERLLPVKKTELGRTESKWKETSDTFSRIQGKLDEIKKAIEILDRAVKTGEEKCPVCGRHLNAKDAETARAHLEFEQKSLVARLRKLQTEKTRLQARVENLRKECDLLRTKQAKVELLKDHISELRGAEKELKELKLESEKKFSQLKRMEERVKKELGRIPAEKEVTEKIQSLSEQIAEEEDKLRQLREVPGKLKSLERRNEELIKEAEELEKEIEKAAPIKQRENELRKAVEELKRHEEEISGKIERGKEELGRTKGEIKSLKEQMEEIRKEKQELERLKKSVSKKKLLEQAYDCLYSQVFHERGLPVVFIKNLLGRVEVVARDYLGRLLPGFDLFLDADEKGEIRIDVLDREIIRPLETYSGGEKVILGFVLRLAIARTMTLGMRAFPPRYLLIDEGFGPLSKDFRHAVLGTLMGLSAQYDQIVIVSHMEDIREYPNYDSFIRVFKDEAGISHVELSHSIS